MLAGSEWVDDWVGAQLILNASWAYDSRQIWRRIPREQHPFISGQIPTLKLDIPSGALDIMFADATVEVFELRSLDKYVRRPVIVPEHD